MLRILKKNILEKQNLNKITLSSHWRQHIKLAHFESLCSLQMLLEQQIFAPIFIKHSQKRIK